MIFRDDAHLQERLAYWQGVLRLQDWDVKAKIASCNELANKCYGDIDYFEHRKIANIRIMAAEDFHSFDRKWEPEFDQERVLVHELLHIPQIHTKPEENEGLAYDMWEQAIEQMARAFVRLDRKYESPHTH